VRPKGCSDNTAKTPYCTRPRVQNASTWGSWYGKSKAHIDDLNARQWNSDSRPLPLINHMGSISGAFKHWTGAILQLVQLDTNSKPQGSLDKLSAAAEPPPAISQ